MFTKDTRTETYLTQMGVESNYTNSLTFGQLVPTWDTVNLARPVPIREDAVCEYATLMEAGSPAPAPILHRTARGLDVLDGVQRLSAAKLSGCSIFSGYVVECDSEAIVTAIRVLSNARLQGHAEPPEWTRRRAVEMLVVQGGMTPEEVARMGGWKASDVAALAKALSWGFEIRAIGGPSLPDSVVRIVAESTSLESLRANAEPVAKFLRTVSEARLSASDAAPYIAQFFSGRPSFDTLRHRCDEVAADAEISTRIHGRRAGPMPRDVRLRATLKSAVTILDEIRSDGGELLYVDEFFRLTKQINAKLHAMSGKHEKATIARVPADMYQSKAAAK